MASSVRLSHFIQWVQTSSGGVTNNPTHRSDKFKDITNRLDRMRRNFRLDMNSTIRGRFPIIVKNATNTLMVQYQRVVVGLFEWKISAVGCEMLLICAMNAGNFRPQSNRNGHKAHLVQLATSTTCNNRDHLQSKLIQKKCYSINTEPPLSGSREYTAYLVTYKFQRVGYKFGNIIFLALISWFVLSRMVSLPSDRKDW